jgi:hypothetical protein
MGMHDGSRSGPNHLGRSSRSMRGQPACGLSEGLDGYLLLVERTLPMPVHRTRKGLVETSFWGESVGPPNEQSPIFAGET